MPLTEPAKPEATDEGGELINWSQEWKRMAEAKSVVLLHIRERLEDEDYGNGPVARFSVDALFVTGPRTGELHTDVWVLGKGITSSLLREKIGAEVPYRLDMGKRGTTPFAKADLPTPEEFDEVKAVYRERWWESANGKVPASVGAGTSQPADDDTPPF